MNALSSARVIVTGGSRGIGFACARHFARMSCRVRTVARGNLAAEAPGLNWQHDRLDLANGLPTDDWATFLTSTEGPSVIIQALGGTLGVAASAPAAEWQRVMDLNFLLPLSIHQALLPILRERPPATVVFIGSSSVWHGQASTPYACAKAALHRFVASVGPDLAHKDVLVCAVAPGAVSGYGNSWDRCRHDKPEVWAETAARQPLHRFQTPDEIADVIGWIIRHRPMELAGAVLDLDTATVPSGDAVLEYARR